MQLPRRLRRYDGRLPRSSMLGLSGWLISALVCACGDDGAARPGADAGLAPDGAIVDPWLPASPAPPVLAPCPSGWAEVVIDGLPACEPFPAGVLECPSGEAHFPGETACARVGSECPAGAFADDAPPGAVFVDAGASGGTGTRESPLASLTDALRVTPAGGTIILAPGRYEGPFTIRTGVTVKGACAASTLLTVPATFASGSVRVVSADGARIVLRDLTIGRAATPGVQVVGEGRDLALEGVVIEQTRGTAVLAGLGAVLTARDLSIRDIDIAEGSTARGYGVAFEAGGSSTLERISIVRATGAGIIAGQSPAVVSVRDAVVRDTRGAPVSLQQGMGILVANGPRIEGTRVAVYGNRDHGVLIDAATARLEDAVVSGTLSAEGARDFGRGVGVQNGAAAELRRVRIENNRDAGLHASTGSEVVIEDSFIRDTDVEEASQRGGRGINAVVGAVVRGARIVLQRNHDTAAAVEDGGSRIALEDATVLDTLPTFSPDMPGAFGVGLVAFHGGQLELRRARIGRARSVGIFVADEGANAYLEDVRIHEMLPHEYDGRFGRALSLQIDARVDAVRCLFESTRDFGVVVVGGSTANLDHVALRTVLPQACSMDGRCPEHPSGSGVGVAYSSFATLTDFQIDGASLCGVQVGNFGDLVLRNGTISNSAIGACVQEPGYDLSKLMDGVVYRDNTITIDSTSLPLPDAALDFGI